MKEVLVALVGFAPLATKATDFVRNLTKQAGLVLADWVWNVVAFGCGIGVAFVQHVQLANVSLLALSPSHRAYHVAAWVDECISGLAIGAAAGGYHELFDLLSAHAKRAKTGTAGVTPDRLR